MSSANFVWIVVNSIATRSVCVYYYVFYHSTLIDCPPKNMKWAVQPPSKVMCDKPVSQETKNCGCVYYSLILFDFNIASRDLHL